MPEKYLKVSELDFDEIRNNLKNYLSTQTRFQDYNFEGSSLSVLLDLLSYNTHYGAYYLNMLANEMFLDTAQQRESVVSRANELGYVSFSSEGSQTSGTIIFYGVETDAVQVVVPKYNTFGANLDNRTYNFVVTKDSVCDNFDGVASGLITIKEGIHLTHRYSVDVTSKQRYVIPNDNVDTTMITVRVQENLTSSKITEYKRLTNVRQILDTDYVYFLEEFGDGKYEIVFGDGILGKALEQDNIVIIDYLVCNGDVTNNMNVFSIGDMNIGVNYESVRFFPEGPTSGGHWQESVESIKFNAPKSYQTQNRAIIANDYARLILQENPDIQSVVSFGGEEAEPAVYGRVYVAVKPYGEEFVTDIRRNQIKASIMDRTPLSIEPVIIDGRFTYIIPTIKTYINSTTTTETTGFIVASIKNAVKNFSADSLERFGNKFRYSRFVGFIDSSSPDSVFNSEVTIKIEQRFLPNTQTPEKVEQNFQNALRKNSVQSSSFFYKGYTCYLDDDGEGNIRIFRYDVGGVKSIVEHKKGTIDYQTGKIVIEFFDITNFSGLEMSIYCEPIRLDINPVREQILVIDVEKTQINVISEYA